MKKFLIVLLLGVAFVTGCSNSDNVVDKMEKKTGSDSYLLKGELQIINNEDKYVYDVESAYSEPDKFRVMLTNKNNNHSQIILKNSTGVYVLTPSLNKSFKFQSDWPYNNSQVYLLKNIMDDILSSEYILEEDGENYIITSDVNFINNKNLDKQKVYVDKNADIYKVEVMSGDNVKMIFNISEIKYDKKFDENYFEVDSNMVTDTKETMGELEDYIYPMYMPLNTHLESQNIIDSDDTKRVILSFEGENPFTLIEEVVNTDTETKTISGDPEILLGSVGYVNDSEASFIKDGVEYYVTTPTMDRTELIKVVNSINVIPVGK